MFFVQDDRWKRCEIKAAMLVAALATACGDSKMMTASDGGSASTTHSSISDSSGDATATEPPTSGTSTGETTSGTTAEPTSGTSTTMTAGTGMSTGDMDAGGVQSCNQWTQDCPEGQKCAPFSSNRNGVHDGLKCVDVKPNPGQPGDACTIEGGGIDDCDEGLICFGTCTPLCIGTPDTPTCAAMDRSCFMASEGVLTLCLPTCDPLAQDCPGTDLCVNNPSEPAVFVCIFDASGGEGTAYDPCEGANDCDKGLLCVSPLLVGQCPSDSSCCTPFCDITNPMCPGGRGQACVPWYGMGEAPPGYENVGICEV